MKALIVNCGSSSIKCSVYDCSSALLWKAHVEWKNNFDQMMVVAENNQGQRLSEPLRGKSIQEAIRFLIGLLPIDKKEIQVVGHRIVHGGKYFEKSIRIDQGVKQILRDLVSFAPLHNLLGLEAIEIAQTIFPDILHVAVFDTAFHHTLEPAARIYPGPYSWYEEGIQKYGFHGISFQYCAKKLPKENNKVILCHLGAGASLCALKDGKSIDTTMGFTPLDGLMMDTRCGSIDPGIFLYLLKEKQKTVEDLTQELYCQSGVLGLFGMSSDMKDVIEERKKNNFRAQIAFDVYMHRLISLIGSMLASLQGVDAFVFTGGIGENCYEIREKVCLAFSFLGLDLDREKNRKVFSEDLEITTQSSKVKAFVIHTQEAWEIAQECFSFL